jgi:hypothetical protein
MKIEVFFVPVTFYMNSYTRSRSQAKNFGSGASKLFRSTGYGSATLLLRCSSKIDSEGAVGTGTGTYLPHLFM